MKDLLNRELKVGHRVLIITRTPSSKTINRPDEGSEYNVGRILGFTVKTVKVQTPNMLKEYKEYIDMKQKGWKPVRRFQIKRKYTNKDSRYLIKL